MTKLLISQIIASYDNKVCADASTLAPRINLEAVLARYPEVMVTGSTGGAQP